MAHKSVTRRRRGGSIFESNRLTIQQRVRASERLSKKSGGKLSLAEALKRINKAQFEREARLRKRKR